MGGGASPHSWPGLTVKLGFVAGPESRKRDWTWRFRGSTLIPR